MSISLLLLDEHLERREPVGHRPWRRNDLSRDLGEHVKVWAPLESPWYLPAAAAAMLRGAPHFDMLPWRE